MDIDLDEVLPERQAKRTAPESKCAPPPVPHKVARKASAKKKGAPGVRCCRGCKGWFGPQDMSENQNVCHKDKRAINNIYNGAVAQGQKDWAKEHIDDDEKLEEMLINYHEKCPEIDNGRRPKGQSNKFVLQYKEKIVSSSGATLKERRKMMWEEEFFEFSMSPKGGSYSRGESEAMWASMSAEGSGVYQDQHGPQGVGKLPRHKIRCGVVKGSFIDFSNNFFKSREIELAYQSQKNANQDTVDSLTKTLQQDHDKMISANNNLSLEEVAKGMVVSSGQVGKAFDGQAVNLGDVRALINQDSKEKAPESGGSGSKEDDEKTKLVVAQMVILPLLISCRMTIFSITAVPRTLHKSVSA